MRRVLLTALFALLVLPGCRIGEDNSIDIIEFEMEGAALDSAAIDLKDPAPARVLAYGDRLVPHCGGRIPNPGDPRVKSMTCGATAGIASLLRRVSYFVLILLVPLILLHGQWTGADGGDFSKLFMGTMKKLVIILAALSIYPAFDYVVSRVIVQFSAAVLANKTLGDWGSTFRPEGQDLDYAYVPGGVFLNEDDAAQAIQPGRAVSCSHKFQGFVDSGSPLSDIVQCARQTIDDPAFAQAGARSLFTVQPAFIGDPPTPLIYGALIETTEELTRNLDGVPAERRAAHQTIISAIRVIADKILEDPIVLANNPNVLAVQEAMADEARAKKFSIFGLGTLSSFNPWGFLTTLVDLLMTTLLILAFLGIVVARVLSVVLAPLALVAAIAPSGNVGTWFSGHFKILMGALGMSIGFTVLFMILQALASAPVSGIAGVGVKIGFLAVTIGMMVKVKDLSDLASGKVTEFANKAGETAVSMAKVGAMSLAGGAGIAALSGGGAGAGLLSSAGKSIASTDIGRRGLDWAKKISDRSPVAKTMSAIRNSETLGRVATVAAPAAAGVRSAAVGIGGAVLDAAGVKAETIGALKAIAPNVAAGYKAVVAPEPNKNLAAAAQQADLRKNDSAFGARVNGLYEASDQIRRPAMPASEEDRQHLEALAARYRNVPDLELKGAARTSLGGVIKMLRDVDSITIDAKRDRDTGEVQKFSLSDSALAALTSQFDPKSREYGTLMDLARQADAVGYDADSRAETVDFQKLFEKSSVFQDLVAQHLDESRALAKAEQTLAYVGGQAGRANSSLHLASPLGGDLSEIAKAVADSGVPTASGNLIEGPLATATTAGLLGTAVAAYAKDKTLAADVANILGDGVKVQDGRAVAVALARDPDLLAAAHAFVKTQMDANNVPAPKGGMHADAIAAVLADENVKFELADGIVASGKLHDAIDGTTQVVISGVNERSAFVGARKSAQESLPQGSFSELDLLAKTTVRETERVFDTVLRSVQGIADGSVEAINSMRHERTKSISDEVLSSITSDATREDLRLATEDAMRLPEMRKAMAKAVVGSLGLEDTQRQEIERKIDAS